MSAPCDKTRQPTAMHWRGGNGAVAAALALWALSGAAADVEPAMRAALRDPCANARDRERCEAQRAAVESCRDEPVATGGECIRTRLPAGRAEASSRAGPQRASPEEICRNRSNAERCEERLAAEESCRDVPPQGRSECIRENMRPPRPRCEVSRGGLQKAECEIQRTATLPCMELRGAAARACIASKTPSLKQEHFNGLDCANPGPDLAARCTYRQIVLAGCGTLSPADDSKCRLQYLAYTTDLRQCGGAPARMGNCLLHNRVLGNCRGMAGMALDLCLSREVRIRFASVVNCGAHDATAVEKQYCAKYDEALTACMNEFGDPGRFKACVTRSVPAALTLAALALQPLRMGVPH